MSTPPIGADAGETPLNGPVASEPPIRVAEAMRLLLARRSEFLRFLERRLRDPAQAEDVLQEALIKGHRGLHALEKPEALVPWFYRLLRTTLVDDRRKAATRERTLHALGLEPTAQSFDEAPARACACLDDALAALRPEHHDVIARVVLEDVAVRDYAEQTGISSGNAAVRSFRAKAALRKSVEHTCGSCASDGCADCTCARTAPDASSTPVSATARAVDFE